MRYDQWMLNFVGTLCLDRIVAAEKLPSSGEKVSIVDTALVPGGGAGNSAAWAAYLGADSHLTCALADDDLGRRCQALAQMDNLTLHVRSAERTIESLVIVEPHGERSCIYNQSGQLGELSGAMLDIAARSFGTWAELSRSRTVDRAALAAVAPRFGVPVQHLEIAASEGLKLTWTIGSIADAPIPSDDLLRQVGCEIAIMTDGAKGSLVWNGNDWHHVPAQAGVRVVDATGAGDSFLAGVLVALEKGADAVAAARSGSETAARCVTQAGGWPH